MLYLSSPHRLYISLGLCLLPTHLSIMQHLSLAFRFPSSVIVLLSRPHGTAQLGSLNYFLKYRRAYLGEKLGKRENKEPVNRNEKWICGSESDFRHFISASLISNRREKCRTLHLGYAIDISPRSSHSNWCFFVAGVWLGYLFFSGQALCPFCVSSLGACLGFSVCMVLYSKT